HGDKVILEVSISALNFEWRARICADKKHFRHGETNFANAEFYLREKSIVKSIFQ
ncbi:hypothetical protein AMTR_s02350p00009160, partial [Amborella trichopoda]